MIKKSRSDIRVFFFILLCTSLLLFYTINTNATDLSTSELIMPSDTLALQRIELSVLANGTSDVVSGATVNISSTLGTFEASDDSWTIGITDGTGIVNFWWISPDTPTEINPINVTIIANITSSPDNIVTFDNITVHPIDFSTSSMDITPKTVYELHNSIIEVYANSSIFPYGVENATVDLTCDEGNFVDSGTATTALETDASGFATIGWTANLSIVIASPLLVNITAVISYTGKIVTTTLNDNIMVNPMDFNSSTILLSSYDVGGSEVVDVTTRAVGDYGAISEAEIFLIALDGNFSGGYTNITGYTNDTGYYTTTWTSPEVSADTSILIEAEFRYPTTTLLTTINATVLVRADVHDFTTILLVANSTTATVGDLIEITVTTTNELLVPVEYANVTFTAPEGVFVGSGTDTITVQTNSSGMAEVIWDTSTTTPSFDGFDYLIGVELILDYYNTNTSSITIHVDPVIYQLETDSSATPSPITQGANVTITVYVSANGVAINDSTVTILAQSGIFAISGEEIAQKNTDESGIVVFTWITAEMTLTQARDFSFTISAVLVNYDPSDNEIITVHVNPATTEPPPDDGELTTYEMLGILVGAVAGVLLIGLLGYQIVKRKPIS